MELEQLERHLSLLPATDWQKVFAFIPVFEASGRAESDDVSKFCSLLYNLDLVVSFDWPHWEDGRRLVNNPELLNTISDPVVCVKLLTALVRGDRFNEGLLEFMCSNGTVVGILKAMKRIMDTDG